NAKAEGIEGKPAFREAFQRRRCLVPVDNFYEWKKTAPGKQPYAVALADRGLMALAGLWENWRSPAGEWVRSFAIITTTPNELCSGDTGAKTGAILRMRAGRIRAAMVAAPRTCSAGGPCWTTAPKLRARERLIARNIGRRFRKQQNSRVAISNLIYIFKFSRK